MTWRLFPGALLLAGTLLVPVGAEAQPSRALSLDASIGQGRSYTAGEFDGDGKGLAVDALLALRLRPAGSGALVAGLGASSQGEAARNDICRVAPSGGCLSSHPHFSTIGALLGWESARGRLRVMGGPSFVSADSRSTFGVQGRVDGAVPVSRHLALIASLRGTLVPDHGDDAFRLLAYGVGVRIH